MPRTANMPIRHTTVNSGPFAHQTRMQNHGRHQQRQQFVSGPRGGLNQCFGFRARSWAVHIHALQPAHQAPADPDCAAVHGQQRIRCQFSPPETCCSGPLKQMVRRDIIQLPARHRSAARAPASRKRMDRNGSVANPPEVFLRQ